MVLSAPSRSGAWTSEPGFGVYVHIPFCRHRCHYCDFNTYEGLDSQHDVYVDALVEDVRRWPVGGPAATSVFFGGGTPTLLPAAALGRILAAVGDRVGLAPGAEVTLEANPETVDGPVFEALLAAGFNRLSLGVQSTSATVLQGLGRTHSSARALQAIREARAAGFDDVNADLIYGSPWETEADWRRSLEDVLAVEPSHVSAYALTVEEGTPLHTLVATERVPDVDPDVQAERHAIADELLGGAGFHRYEVSNWARPDRACRHNLVYWCGGDYLAFGAGAHGHLAGRRWWTVRLPRDFIDAVAAEGSTEAGAETLTTDERAGEALMLGLRLTSGIDVAEFQEVYGSESWTRRGSIVAEAIDSGFLETSGGHLRVTEAATFVANDVICRLL